MLRFRIVCESTAATEDGTSMRRCALRCAVTMISCASCSPAAPSACCAAAGSAGITAQPMTAASRPARRFVLFVVMSFPLFLQLKPQ